MSNSPGTSSPERERPPGTHEPVPQDAPPSRQTSSSRASRPQRGMTRKPAPIETYPTTGPDNNDTDSGERRKQVAPVERLQDAAYPRYGIGVVTDLTGIPVQQLRRYEEAGLLKPQRTPGGTRQYSDADVVRLLEIGQLNEEGVNLPGIRRILQLRAQLAAVRTKRTSRSESDEEQPGAFTQRRKARRPSQISHRSPTGSPDENES